MSLRARILTCEYDSAISSHLGARRMYDAMQKLYCRPQMVNDGYDYVKECQTCGGHRHWQTSTHRRLLQLSFPEEPLNFVVSDILGPFPITRAGNKSKVKMTGGYSILTRAIPSSMTSATNTTQIIIDDWITPYEMPEWLLTDSRPQFVGKIFDAASFVLETKLMVSAAYHLQTNGQTNRY